MSIDACARLVQQGDPDRFLSAMTAPPNTRGALMVLYAFNLELARAPWVTSEPVIAEMRLQFWADTLDNINTGKPAPAHEVAAPLVTLQREKSLPLGLLQQMVAARRFDIYTAPQPSLAAQTGYIDQTAGHLMWLASMALGAKPADQAQVQSIGHAAGLAALLRAYPALAATGRQPLLDPSPQGIAQLARDGLARLKSASKPPTAKHIAPALRAGWLSKTILTRAEKDPQAVLQDRLAPSEFTRRRSLIIKVATGGW